MSPEEEEEEDGAFGAVKLRRTNQRPTQQTTNQTIFPPSCGTAGPSVASHHVSPLPRIAAAWRRGWPATPMVKKVRF